MKQSILDALSRTLKPDQQTIKKATDDLALLRKNPGFFVELMDIADGESVSIDIRQAALASLKVSVERRWTQTSRWKPDFYITEVQKNQIRMFLMKAMVRCQNSRKLIRLYKEIVRQIVLYDYQSWVPVDQIIQALSSGDPTNIVPALHFAFAVVHSFQSNMEAELVQYMGQTFCKISPALLSTLHSNRNLEIVYLMTKILWKSLHYELAECSKAESLKWIPIIVQIVKYQDANLAPKYAEQLVYGSQEFFYFHSKKWANRILFRFALRHANYKFNKSCKQFSDLYYNNFGVIVSEALIFQLSVPTTPKVKYFVLKTLKAIADSRPLYIDSAARDLLFVILPPLLCLTPKDEALAKEDAAEFLRLENDHMQSFTNVKRGATELWQSLNQIDSSGHLLDDYQPGKYLFQSMAYLNNKLLQNDMVQKEMAMYVLCQIEHIIHKVKQIKQAIPTLIARYVITEFANPVMFLRARAVQLFTEYGDIDLKDKTLLQTAVDGIYNCLANDPATIVRVKAACAFNCILHHKEATQMVKPNLKNILAVYLTLLDKFDLEDLVSSLEGIIERFSSQVSPFAAELIQHLARIFIKYSKIDNQKSHMNDNYDGDVEMAAAGCLSAISKILETPLPKDVYPRIEQAIDNVVSFCMTAEGNQHFAEGAGVLGQYLYGVDVINQRFWFFYPTIIYYLKGLDKSVDTSKLQKFNPMQDAIFENIKQGVRIDEISEIISTLRQFIAKGVNVLLTQTDYFGQNLMSLLFKLVQTAYKPKAEQLKNQQDDLFGDDSDTCKATVTAILTHLLEWYCDDNILKIVWVLLKTNFGYGNKIATFLRVINCELLFMCLHRSPSNTVALMQSQNLTDTILKAVIKLRKKFEEEHSKQRLILGLSSLFRLETIPQNVGKYLPTIFDWLVAEVKNVSEIRQEAAKQQEEEPDNKQESGSEQMTESDSDELNIRWDEMVEQCYSSPLDKLDQVTYFEQSLMVLQIKQPIRYQVLVAQMKEAQLNQLKTAVQKSKVAFAKHMAVLGFQKS